MNELTFAFRHGNVKVLVEFTRLRTHFVQCSTFRARRHHARYLLRVCKRNTFWSMVVRAVFAHWFHLALALLTILSATCRILAANHLTDVHGDRESEARWARRHHTRGLSGHLCRVFTPQLLIELCQSFNILSTLGTWSSGMIFTTFRTERFLTLLTLGG